MPRLEGSRGLDAVHLFGTEGTWRGQGVAGAVLGAQHDILDKQAWFQWLHHLLRLLLGCCCHKSKEVGMD